MAEPRYDTVQVRVEDQVLWIDSDAYPVQNIARAQARRVTLKKPAPPVGPFIKSLLKCLALGIIGTIVLGLAHASAALDAVLWLIAAAFLVRAVVRLINGLGKQDRIFYTLMIETSGSPHDLIVSDNLREIEKIIANVMQAINDARIKFETAISNYHVDGDLINASGTHSTGKIINA